MVATHESDQNESKIVWHKRFYNWMRRNILGILFVLALVLIGSWALYTLDYSYKTISQGVFLLPDDIGRVYYPEHLLLFSEPSAIQVDFTQKTTDPLMFILHFPDTIQAQVSPTMTSRIITLTVVASQTITSTPIVLQNAGMWTGLWNELMGHDESIRVEGVNGKSKIVIEPDTFNIKLEGRYKGIIRQFLSSTVNQNSPLILASVALIALTRVYLDYQERQRKEREEKEKEQQNKEKAGREIHAIRAFLCQANVPEAKRLWLQFQDSPLLNYVSDETKKRIRDLLQIVDGKWITDTQSYTEIKPMLISQNEDWLSEIAGIIITAYREFMTKTSRSQLGQANHAPLRTDFPINKLRDVTLKDHLWRLRHQLEVLDLQPWRADIVKTEDRLVDDPLAKTTLAVLLQNRNPLGYSKAEADKNALYGENKGFWSKPYSDNQSVVRWLALLPVNYVLYGKPGCGRTAMAYALYNLFDVQSEKQQSFFMIYFSESNLNQLKITIANELLTYINNKPTLLLNFNDGVRSLCAHLLIHTVGIDRIRVAIAESQEQKGWLKDADPQQKPVWEQVGHTQLELFLKAVDQANRMEPLANDAEWVRALLSCIRAWGFRGVKVVVDLQTNEPSLLESWLHSEWFRWEMSGFVIILFTPIEGRKIRPLEKMLQDLDLPSTHLSWGTEDIQEMMAHRFRVICHKDVLECFDTAETFSTFVEKATGNPQMLVRLWQRCLSEMSDDDFRITPDILEKASN